MAPNGGAPKASAPGTARAHDANVGNSTNHADSANGANSAGGVSGARRPRAQALPRARRIRKRAEFVAIQQSDARVTTPNLLMLLAIRPAAGPARLGVVASRKVGPAVARNRVKRLVREAFRRNLEVFPPRIDVVVVVRPGTHRLGAQEIAEQVRRARPHLERRAAELSRGARTRPPALLEQRPEEQGLEVGPKGAPTPGERAAAKGTPSAAAAGKRSPRGRTRDTGEAMAPPEEHALDRLRRR